MKKLIILAVGLVVILMAREAAASYCQGSATQHPNGGGKVDNTATVDDSVYVGPLATICDNAKLTGNANIINSHVFGDAQVSGNAVLNSAYVHRNAQISGSAVVHGVMYDNAQVSGTAIVYHGARIGDNGKVNCGTWTNITVTTDRRGECGSNGNERRNLVQELIHDPLTVIDPENTQSTE